MSKCLEYKGYLGSVEFDTDDNCLFGKILFINDAIYYQAESVAALKSTFEDSIDEYLETCEEIGKEPQKPFSGSFNIRIDPNLHRKLAHKSKRHDISINAAVAKAIDEFVSDNPVKSEVIHKTINYQFNYEDLKPSLYIVENRQNANLRLVK